MRRLDGFTSGKIGDGAAERQRAMNPSA